MDNTQEKQLESPNKIEGKTALYQERPGGKFKKNNPGGGRPKGSKDFSTLMDEAVEEIAKANNITKSEVWQVIIRKGYSEAKNGNFMFYKDILDRYFGKAKESIDLTSGGKTIEPEKKILVDKAIMMFLNKTPDDETKND